MYYYQLKDSSPKFTEKQIKPLIKNTEVISTLQESRGITITSPHAETFMISQLNWKYLKILKFRLD